MDNYVMKLPSRQPFVKSFLKTHGNLDADINIIFLFEMVLNLITIAVIAAGFVAREG